jgi:hypothetical protein
LPDLLALGAALMFALAVGIYLALTIVLRLFVPLFTHHWSRDAEAGVTVK